MALPKIEHPIHNIKVPSKDKTYKFRPFLVKEEKILLMAKESKNSYDILTAIKQIVNNCSIEDTFDVDKITLFDLEYIFLKLRAVSIDNMITKLPFYDMVDFIVDNNLNRNKQWVYSWIQILKENNTTDSQWADENFSVEKFLEAINFWEV